MKWRYLNTGLHTGDWNMSFDEETASRFNAATDLPILRVYGWRPFTISIGIHQQIEAFDLTKLQKDSIGIVRRPTGGRAIYHAHELTYSVILAANGRSAREIYQYLSMGILSALRFMGIGATISGVDEQIPDHRNNPLAIPCFSTSTRSEIQWHGKKIVGSAQRRYRDTILQHGSFLLGTEHRRILEYLSPGVQGVRSVIENHLTQRTVEAESILGKAVSFDEAAEFLRMGFEKAHQITFIPSNPEEINQRIEEQQLVQQS